MNGFPGCFTYLFLVSFGVFGFVPLGRHSADFSKDGNKIAIAHRLKDIRIMDTATRELGPSLYTAPPGYVVDSVHWSKADGAIYAVAHNGGSCSNHDPEKENPLDKKWNVRLLRIGEDAKAHETISDRSYYCPASGGLFDGEIPDSEFDETFHYEAAYQNLYDNFLNFKPSGWDTGAVYFVEPEEFTSKAPAVTRLDLKSGKTEKAFTLPSGGFAYMLSDDARYLMRLAGDGEDNYIIELYETGTGKKLFRDTVLNAAYSRLFGGADVDASMVFAFKYIVSLSSGIDGFAAIDSGAGKLFYLKMNDDDLSVSLESLDINSGARKTLLVAPALYAPILIPQKNAVLITSHDSQDFSEISSLNRSIETGAMAKVFPFPLKGKTSLKLVSYDGTVLKKYDMPPFFSPLLHLLKPDIAISPDGNLIAVNIETLNAGLMAKLENPDTEMTMVESDVAMSDILTSIFDILPVLIDIEHGTFEIVTDRPRDAAVAGIYLLRTGYDAEAKVYFERYPLDYDALDMHTLFNLFSYYQKSGDPRMQTLYEIIINKLPKDAESASVLFIEKYLSVFGSDYRFSQDTVFAMMDRDEKYRWLGFMNYCEKSCLDAPPFFWGLDAGQLEFIANELSRPENANSSMAAFLLGAVFYRLDRPLDAIPYLERALQLSPCEQKTDSTVSDKNRMNDKFFVQLCSESRLNTLRLISEIYENEGLLDKAVEIYTSVLANMRMDDKYFSETLEMRALLLDRLGRNSEAIADYEMLLEQEKEALADDLRLLEAVRSGEQGDCEGVDVTAIESEDFDEEDAYADEFYEEFEDDMLDAELTEEDVFRKSTPEDNCRSALSEVKDWISRQWKRIAELEEKIEGLK